MRKAAKFAPRTKDAEDKKEKKQKIGVEVKDKRRKENLTTERQKISIGINPVKK